MLIDTIETNATIGTTEYSMGLASTAGAPTALTIAALCQLFVDGNALLAGDEFLIQVYEKAISGGTQRVVQRITILGTMLIDSWDLGLLKNGYDVTIKKIAGTDRAIPMSLRRAQATATADITQILADTNDIQARLPAALSAGGYMKADVQEWRANAVAVPTTNGVPEVDVTYWRGGLIGAPSYVGVPEVECVLLDTNATSAGEIARLQNGLATAAALTRTLGLTLDNARVDECVYSAGKLTSSRIRVFADDTALTASTSGAADDADGEIARYATVTTYSGDDMTSHKVTREL